MNKKNKPRVLVLLALLLISHPSMNKMAGAASTIFASVLPASRAVAVNGTATAYATIINAGASDASGCSISLPAGVPGTSTYQTTAPSTNAPTGTSNTPTGIAAGAAQSLVFGIHPTAISPQTDYRYSSLVPAAKSGIRLAASIRSY